MDTKLIPLIQREMDRKGTLNECCDSSLALVVELPDNRMVTIQPLEPDEALVEPFARSAHEPEETSYA
jgi:hypothetical protein